MKYFFSTVRYEGGPKVYEAVVGAMHERAEDVAGQKLVVIDKDTLLIRKRNYLRNCLFLGRIVATGAILTNNIIYARYRGYNIGRYAIPSALRDFESFKSPPRYYRRLVEALLTAMRLIDGILNYCEDVEAAFVEHGCYINGVFFEVFSERGIPIYHDHYPYNLVKWTGEGKQGFEHAVMLPHSDRVEDIQAGKHALEEVLTDPGLIPYMNATFEEKMPENLEFNYIVYCHSFTDAQMGYGYDGAFKSVYEWLVFTLGCLQGKKVCLKAHPNFYASGYQSEIVEWDKKIFDCIIEAYKSDPNITIIDYALKNNELLKRVDMKTTLLSHHSNALLEGGAMGFKCISSNATSWHNYTIFNTWNNKERYKALLSVDNEDLAPTNEAELFAFYGRLHDKNAGIFGDNNIGRVISRVVGCSVGEFIRSPDIMNSMSDEQLSSLKFRLKSLVVDCI